jgi:hypothetical protein
VDVVPLPEVFLEHPAVSGNAVEAEQRFPASYAGAKRAHRFCLGNDPCRIFNQVLVGIDIVFSLAAGRKRAVPARTVAPSRNKEHHLCALVAEDTAGGKSHRNLHVEVRIVCPCNLILGCFEVKILIA